MTLVENKFSITDDEARQVKDMVDKIMDTFPANIAEHIVDDIEIELTGMYILTVCNSYLKTLSPGIAGDLIVGSNKYAIIKIEEDILISSL